MGWMMHGEALQWVSYSYNKNKKTEDKIKVLEFGSLDINGSVRSILEPLSDVYIGVDMQEGPGVDVVQSAVFYEAQIQFDVVVCCEVFEHTPDWREIISNAHKSLVDGGLFIATMAGEGRSPHSAIDQNPIRDWEYYANVGAWELNRKLKMFSKHEIDYLANDLRCWAVKTSD